VTSPLPERTFTATKGALIFEIGGGSHMAIAPHLRGGRAGPPRAVRALDEADLACLSNHELDDLFRAGAATLLPTGTLRGTALVFNGTLACRVIAKLAYWVAWQGKRVDPTRDGLVNRISPFRLPLIRATVRAGDSWVDGEPCTVLDYSRTSLVARMVRDETRVVSPGLQLGVVWLWRRRAAWFTLRDSRH
jgi:hypothetical protein